MRVFLAHASEDKEVVREIHKKLASMGFSPWLDEIDLLPGQNWRAEIPRAIEESDIFVACFSKQSVQKYGYVQQELRLALSIYARKPSNAIFLIPLRLDECEIPDLNFYELGVSLRSIQWQDIWKPDGFERLVEAIKVEAKKKHL